jgi:hypothetical protein
MPKGMPSQLRFVQVMVVAISLMLSMFGLQRINNSHPTHLAADLFSLFTVGLMGAFIFQALLQQHQRIEKLEAEVSQLKQLSPRIETNSTGPTSPG